MFKQWYHSYENSFPVCSCCFVKQMEISLLSNKSIYIPSVQIIFMLTFIWVGNWIYWALKSPVLYSPSQHLHWRICKEALVRKFYAQINHRQHLHIFFALLFCGSLQICIFTTRSLQICVWVLKVSFWDCKPFNWHGNWILLCGLRVIRRSNWQNEPEHRNVCASAETRITHSPSLNKLPNLV